MRTTLDIEEDVLLAAKERARREHRSVGAVLTELARRGLIEQQPPASESYFGFSPLPSRGNVVSNDLIDRLREKEGV